MSLIDELVLTQLLEGEFLGFNHGLQNLNCMSVEAWVVYHIVFRDSTEEIELLEQLHKERISFDDS